MVNPTGSDPYDNLNARELISKMSSLPRANLPILQNSDFQSPRIARLFTGQVCFPSRADGQMITRRVSKSEGMLAGICFPTLSSNDFPTKIPIDSLENTEKKEA
jgi:hypothetical protein